MTIISLRFPKAIRLCVLALICCAISSRAAFSEVSYLEHPAIPGQVDGIGGFVGQRMAVNKTGSIQTLPIQTFLDMLQKQNHQDWFWIGEQPGKWLDAAVIMSATDHDRALESQTRQVLEQMVKAQGSDGYLGITPSALRTEIKPLRGMDPYEQYFTFHGLLTAWEVWHDPDALQAAKKLADYYLQHISSQKAQFWPSALRPPENVNKVLQGHSDIAGHSVHYGFEGTLVIDPMMRLYEDTHEPRYLEWCQWVVSQMDTWSGWNTYSKLDQVADGKLGIDQIQPQVHSHTFQMNFIGLLRLYRATGDPTLLRKVVGAWKDIAQRQVYITGGVSVGEHYTAGYDLPVRGHVVETCANMSWAQLNQELLQITGDSRYGDYVEKLLVNHVFAAQTIDGECNRYHTPPNGFKPDDYFHGPDCCTSSGMRLISMLPEFFYASSQDKIFVNQFVPSTFHARLGEQTITLQQTTTYPESELIQIHLDLKNPTVFTLKVRLPLWCPKPSLTINHQRVDDLQPGTYASLTRTWKAGDLVELQLPMETHWVTNEHLPDAPVALMHGPVVYALDTVWWNQPSEAKERLPQIIEQEVGVNTNVPPQLLETPEYTLGPVYQVPIKRITGELLQARLVPFANIGKWYQNPSEKPALHSKAYSYAVWLTDYETPAFAGLVQRALANKAPTDALDFVKIDDKNSCTTHHLEASNLSMGVFQGRSYVDAKAPLSVELGVSPEIPTDLIVTYWGGEDVSRTFDIVVNGQKIATETLKLNHPGEFFDQRYPIPFHLIQGKTNNLGQKVDKVVVQFVPATGQTAGGIFGLRTVNNPAK